MPLPLVTVGVASYNYSAYIEEVLESVRRQTYPSIELIVVDDCSTDNSVAIIEAWIARTGFACTLIRNEKNSGPCFTMNESLRRASGKYYCIIGSDDRYLPEKLAVQVAEMEALPESVGALYSDAYIIDSQGNRVLEQAPAHLTAPPAWAAVLDGGAADMVRSPKMFIAMNRVFAAGPPSGNLWAELVEGNFIPAMTCLWRTSAVEAVGGVDLSLFFEDYDLLLRLARRFEIRYSSFPSVEYRIHETNMHKKAMSKAWQQTLVHIFAKHVGVNEKADKRIQQWMDYLVVDLYGKGQEESKPYYAMYNQLFPDANKTLGLAFRTGLPYWRLVQMRRAASRVASLVTKR